MARKKPVHFVPHVRIGRQQDRSTPGYKDSGPYRPARYVHMMNHSHYAELEGKLSADPEEYYNELWKEVERDDKRER